MPVKASIGIFAAFLVACGTTGPKGDQGDPGMSTGTASISSVLPRVGCLDRELDIAIAGSETSFDATTTVSFGSGVTVTQVSVISPATA